MRGEVPDLDPGKDEEAGVAQQHVAVAVAPPLAPADPFVAHRQVQGAVLEQQAAEAAAGFVQQEVADVAAERLAVGKIMVAVDQSVPQLPVLGAFDRLQPHLAQLRQRPADLRLRVRRRAPDRLAGRFANHVLIDRRQRQDPLRLQRLEHGLAGLDLVAALFGAPVEMLADGAGEVVAAGMEMFSTVHLTSSSCQRVNRRPEMVVAGSFAMSESMPTLRIGQTQSCRCRAA